MLKVKADIGDIDILVNNAGIVTGKKFMDSADALIVKTMEVNTMAPFWVSSVFWVGSGRIRTNLSCIKNIYISSRVGI